MKKSMIIHVNHIGGHHESFLKIFRNAFEMDTSIGRIDFKIFKNLVRADHLLFATLDDDVFGFLFISIIRSFIGKRTAALFLRPHTCFYRNWRSLIKRILFILLKLFPRISTYSFLPFEAAPHLRTVATDCVHDPQLWDLIDITDPIDADMELRVRQISDGRPVLVFLGTVTRWKGIDTLAEILRINPLLSKEVCVIVAGRVEEDCKIYAAQCEAAGAIVWDRRVSDEELSALYETCDLVWACYHADYDQASGIFGRAVQYGRRAIIREGAAIVGYYSQVLNLHSITVSSDVAGVGPLGQGLDTFRKDKTSNIIQLRIWRSEFFQKLKHGLGLEQ